MIKSVRYDVSVNYDEDGILNGNVRKNEEGCVRNVNFLLLNREDPSSTYWRA